MKMEKLTTDKKEMVHILNNHIKSVFVFEPEDDMPCFIDRTGTICNPSEYFNIQTYVHKIMECHIDQNYKVLMAYIREFYEIVKRHLHTRWLLFIISLFLKAEYRKYRSSRMSLLFTKQTEDKNNQNILKFRSHPFIARCEKALFMTWLWRTHWIIALLLRPSMNFSAEEIVHRIYLSGKAFLLKLYTEGRALT